MVVKTAMQKNNVSYLSIRVIGDFRDRDRTITHLDRIITHLITLEFETDLDTFIIASFVFILSVVF